MVHHDSGIKCLEQPWTLPPVPNEPKQNVVATVTMNEAKEVEVLTIQNLSSDNSSETVREMPQCPTVEESDDDSITIEFNESEPVPSGSLLANNATPPSQTNVCDFPYYVEDDTKEHSMNGG